MKQQSWPVVPAEDEEPAYGVIADDFGRTDGSHGQQTTDLAPAPSDWPSYLGELCSLLWPPPAVVTVSTGRPGRHRGPAAMAAAPGPRRQTSAIEFLLVSGPRRLPFVVPPGRAAAAAAVRHYSATRFTTRMVGKVLSAGLATGLGPWVFPGRVRADIPAGAEGIDTYLREALGQDLQISMLLGPPRANRKPVLQVLSQAGEPLGFAKVGVNPLTRDLVRSEHTSLARLSRTGLEGVTVPAIRHFGEWRGLPVLVLDALPVWRRRLRADPRQLAAAMRTVARVDGLRREPIRSGPYLRSFRDRVFKADLGPERAALLDGIDSVAGRLGDTEITHGSWHGDWAPWNMANSERGLLVWDWERFGVGVPVGFDALHHHLQTEVAQRNGDPARVALACVENAPQLLDSFRLDAREARLTAALYLATLAARYVIDRQAQAGARYGSAGTWLIPAFLDSLARL